jgi:hypothetical protein
MNTSASTSGNSAISDLIAKVMDKFDTDKDKKLSANEFSSFLSGLVGGAGVKGMSAVTADDGADTGTGTGTGVSRAQQLNLKEYRGMLAGFDHVKIDNPDIRDAMTSKYQASRIFQNFKPMPENLPAVVEELRAQGINATQTDMDKIDFGDGYGPIDVIQGAYPGGGVAWQWMPRA